MDTVAAYMYICSACLQSISSYYNHNMAVIVNPSNREMSRLDTFIVVNSASLIRL